MKNTLLFNQVKNTNVGLPAEINDFDRHKNDLPDDGFEVKVANKLANNPVIEYEKTMFYDRMEKEKREYIQILLATAITIVASLGPILSISAVVWYVLSALTTIIMGYYGFKNKIAGAICGLLIYGILYFSLNYCLTDHVNLLYVFIILPIFFTLIPTFLLYRLLNKIIPSK